MPSGVATRAQTDCAAVSGADKWLYADTGDLASVEKALKRAVDAIGPLHGCSDAEKARAVHDWICRHMTYADAGSERYRMNWRGFQTVWSALEERVTVCTGYARAFKLLCDAYGVSCIVVAGLVHDGPHAWNYVRLEDSWYGVDCTWDDKPGGVAHDWFLRGQSFLVRHTEGSYDALPLAYPQLSRSGYRQDVVV